MYQYKGMTDTIAAIITPSGIGGIGVVRLSGKEAIDILKKIFKSKKKDDCLDEWKSFSTHYGLVYDDRQELIDEVLVTLMRAPKSYTTEDVVEISSHGGVAVVRVLLHTCLHFGARLAEPGEFTKRAFLNGRIDLAQAEAVMSVVQAKTVTALRVSERQLKGDLSSVLGNIREELVELLSHIEAILNFPDESVEEKKKEDILKYLKKNISQVETLLKTASVGRILKEGIRMVIAGKPNVGKSSLLNTLLRTPRAIVTDIAGTTRDIIEEEANINGIPVRLVDTAGILSARDKVEEQAVFRSWENIKTADLVLLVLDQSSSLEDIDLQLLKQLQEQMKIIVLNKIDLPCQCEKAHVQVFAEQKDIVGISVLNKEGLGSLIDRIMEKILQGQILSADGVLLSDIRHIQALEHCQQSLDRAQEALAQQHSFEFISEEIKTAVNALDAITGRFVDDDMIDGIFSKFCIGK